jgi:hypothetical protein
MSKLSKKLNYEKYFALYFHYLDEIGLTINLFKESGGISKLQKPLKVYLENSNLMYALTSSAANTGNIRETFFANQLSHKIMYSDKGDFLINEKYVFEIGGKISPENKLKVLKIPLSPQTILYFQTNFILFGFFAYVRGKKLGMRSLEGLLRNERLKKKMNKILVTGARQGSELQVLSKDYSQFEWFLRIGGIGFV